ncbi:MAG: rhodanese-like domain-containing protein [Bacteroidota bacterium]|nr:rhodanese-like domain-containing protein [Bacteroidota bacterium]
MLIKFFNRFAPSFLIIAAISFNSFGQANNTEPWKENQLIAPAVLAASISSSRATKPVIFSIGPDAIVKGSIDIGPVQEKENLQKLKEQLSKLPKDAAIVIYCGCCPFAKCPNIRPAFQVLIKMKFTNQKLLNLPKNIKVDWMDKGYPMNE